MGLYGNQGKRLLDLAIAVPLALLAAPAMLLTALAVRLRLGSPVLFRQQRPGLDCKPFTLSKFRSMTTSRAADGRLLADEARLTRLGRFLRRWSLDELPELYNVVKGDMSLVGPRPLRMRYLARYSEHQLRRHEVKPGITGLAQVCGRNSLPWEEKFKLDVDYVDNMSLGLDLRILFRTLFQIGRAQGISANNHATMPEFLGSSPRNAEQHRSDYT